MFHPRLLRVLGFIAVIGLFMIALKVLQHELVLYHIKDLNQKFEQLSVHKLLAASLLTVASYALLTLYDVLALRYLNRKLPYRQTALASFLGYVFSYNIGLSILGGGTVRFRLYSLWGLGAVDIGKLIAFSALTFWLGLLTLTGTVFVVDPLTMPEIVHWSMKTTLPIGIMLLLILSFYLGFSASGQRQVHLRGEVFILPSLQKSFEQILLSMLDIICAGSVLYVLLPDIGIPSFPVFVGIYALALFLGLMSHVPGGVGIFESVILLFLTPSVSGSEVLSSLLVYRLLYYLLPFAFGLILYAGFELEQQREGIRKFATWTTKTLAVLAPRMLAAATFFGGALLLLSGATPAMPERLNWLQSVVPLPLIEGAHFLGSLVGLFMLVLARGIFRKLDAAYHLTLIALCAGIFLSLLKGLDYEEASILTFLLLAFLPSRRNFYRRAALFADRFSLEWVLFVAMVLSCSLWLGFFSFKHVEYSHSLWWTFAFGGDAPRFLRASVGASGLLLAFGFIRLMRPARPLERLPQLSDLDRAKPLAMAHSRTLAQLVLVGDKALIFHDSADAFLMYGIYGRSWVSLGGPIGSEEAASDLLWDFRELCDEHGGWEVFYQVHPDSLPLLAENGFSIVKLGEEAIVDLESFSLEGNGRKSLRHAHGRLVKQGLRFEMREADEVKNLLPQLTQISDEWLSKKNSSEKGFSLGFFDPDYLCRTALALAFQGDKLVGFANILASESKVELSIDLMRYLPEAPPGIMDFIFCQLMLWGRAQGYQTFNLGMAPLSGIENKPLSPLWNRFASFLFQHGEHFYNFQGLRSYKEKYHPRWEPRYLAYNPSASLPMVLTQVAALVAGGMTGILKR